MTRKTKKQPTSIQPASENQHFQKTFEKLNRVIHERARLEILTTLVAHPSGLLFGDLKSLCNLTDGNLNRHLKVLSEAELVIAWRSSSRKPQTMYRISDPGKAEFMDYLDALESIIESAQHSIQTSELPRLKIQPT